MSTASDHVVERVPCPVCRGHRSDDVFALYDDRYGFAGSFQLRACASCGHRWIDWQPDAAVLAELYSDYYPRASRSAEDCRPPPSRSRLSAWWHGERSSAYSWVPERVRVLDIGCGFGESLAYHRQRGCDVYGVEADRNIARVAERFGFNVHTGLFDPSIYEPGFFDYVTMDQVIEHMVDPVATLRGVAKVLKPDGRLILTTPNAGSVGARIFGRRWINWHAPYHLHFFTPRSLALACEQAGLSVDSVRTTTSAEWLGYQWVHLLTRPSPGKKSTFWSSTKRSVPTKLLRGWHRVGVDHVVTRALDVLGRGDNYVVHLRKTR